jgi:hypothetical protein
MIERMRGKHDSDVVKEPSSPGQDDLRETIAQHPAKARGATRRRISVGDPDIPILKFVHDCRLLTIEDIGALTGRTYKPLHKRLNLLHSHGYLRRIDDRPQQKHLFHIGQAGIALLLSHGLISDEDAERRRREHELKNLEHEQMIAGIHVMLLLATREKPFELLEWLEGQAVRDSFVAPTGERINITSDAFFHLQDSQSRRGFFLEADQSTMPAKQRQGSERFLDKIERYRWLIHCGRHVERYGVKSVRMVTLCLTAQRRDSLAEKTDRFLVENRATEFRKYFLFGSLEDLTKKPKAVLEPIFRRPDSNTPYGLLPVAQ